MKKKLNIALLSPSKDAFSETFIRVHKDSLYGNIFYYFNGIPPEFLEKEGKINPLWMKIPNFIIGKIIGNPIFDEQQALKKSLKKNKIELVFAEYGNMGNAVVDMCKELNIPLITHFHGADISVSSNVKDNNGYKKVFEYSKKIISVSSVMTKKMIALGCPENKIVYTPCAANDKFREINPILDSQDLLFVGRFVEKKAPDFLIESFKLVVENIPNARLIMVGDGPLMNKCMTLADKLDLNNNIIFKGVLAQSEIINLFKNVRAYVQHSVTGQNGDQEGTPVSISEASMAGLPIISTRHGGIMDIIVENETGLLTDEFDKENTAKNMIKILTDLDLAILLGKNGKKRMIENYSMENHISKLNNAIYK
ncbi:glycosyltransferase [Ornithobacterium rhinotracheale]